MLPSLCFSSTSLSSGCFRSSFGKRSVTTSDSYPVLQILTIAVRSSTSAKPAGPFSLVSLLVSQPFLCLVSCVAAPVPAQAWRCPLIGQPSGSGTLDAFVFRTRVSWHNHGVANTPPSYSHHPRFQSRLANSFLGPHGTNIFDPRSWGNSTDESIDTITLEFTRIVIAIGVFAVGVELPKKYMYRHWKSLFFLLVPVMTWVRSTHSFSRSEAY
jgi:hypothetical protein